MHRLALLCIATGVCLVACTAQVGVNKDAGPDGGLAIGQPCMAASSCESGICLGNCCSNPCISTSDHPECTSCDSSGACQYPTVQCIPDGCDPATKSAHLASLCNNGLCIDAGETLCAASCEGTHCGLGCRGDQDCATGYRCVFFGDGGLGDGGAGDSGSGTTASGLTGTCLPQGTGGQACFTSDDCLSGYCLDGVCCNTACPFDAAHPECAYCDNTGACIYPAVTCLPGQCDPVTNSLLQPSICSKGMCPAQVASSCLAYRCRLGGCATTCLTDQDCASSGFCVQDNGKGECCPIIVNGGTLFVDLVTGTDQACCGVSRETPCRTITRALQVAKLSAAKEIEVGLAPVQRYELDLTIDGGPSIDGGLADWQSPPRGVQTDVFPLILPDGVTLHAPGIELGPLVLGGADPTVSGDGGYHATLEGETGLPLFIGINEHNSLSGPTLMHNGGTIDLSNVVIFGGMVVSGSQSLDVATVINLGLDSQGNAGGPVQFGWDENQGPLNGTKIIPPTQGLLLGINLEFGRIGPPGGPMLLTDYGHPGDSVLRIYNQQIGSWNFGLEITDGVVANLTHGTVVKGGRVDGGYGGVAGIANGGTLYLQGATIANQSLVGLMAANGLTTLEGCTITGNGCYGAAVSAESGEPGLYGNFSNFPLFYSNAWWNRQIGPGGVLQVSHSTITDNFIGVVQDGVQAKGFEGLFTDLSHDSDGGPGGNLIACNGRSHGVLDSTLACVGYASGGPGGDVWNRSVHGMSADNVTWGPTLPTVWTCDDLMTPNSCVSDAGSYCPSGVCSVNPLPAVLSPDFSGGMGSMSLSSPVLSTASCP
jgi:hypothetical protein